MSDLLKTARRAKGSDLLPKVSFGVMNAEVLILRMADRIEALEAENARQTHELKKLWIAISTYENKVQEYASDCSSLSDHAYDWLNEDAGKTARAALQDIATDTVPKTSDNDASQ